MLNSMRTNKALLVVIVFLILAVLLQGCINLNKTEVANNPTMTSSPIMTLTPAATITPTITPLATLNPSEAEVEIYRLMQTNDNCHGFCFWGITSNVTTFTEAVYNLKTLNETRLIMNDDGAFQYNESFRYSERRIGINLEFVDKNGIVKNLYVSIKGIGRLDVPGTEWTAFHIDNYLKANGMPEDFYILKCQKVPKDEFFIP